MCRGPIASIALTAAFLAIPSLAWAQSARASRWEFFAAGGASAVTDKSNQFTVLVGVGSQVVLTTVDTKTHVHPAARLLTGVRYWFTPHDGFEASYSYAPSNITITLVETLTTSSGSTTGVIMAPVAVGSHLYSFNYVRRFHAKGRLQPYLTAGIGGVHWQAISGGNFQSGFANSFAGNLGVGINWNFSSRWALQAEYRDYLIEHPRFTKAAPSGMSHDQSPTVGFVFRF